MGKGAATRDTVIGEALRQAVAVGLEGLSLGGLAETLSLSKSGLFAHFKSKEALQLAVLEEAREQFQRKVIEPAFAAPRGRPRFEALFARWLDWIEGDGSLRGCIFSVASQEYDDRPGAVRDRLVETQNDWHELLARLATDLPAEGKAPVAYGRQLAFEFVGIGLSFQMHCKLMNRRDARERAEEAFARLLVSSE
ncbi:MAG TPA: TetR/AcrR family transcriptional regulator [Phenylobacterium sp.]